MPTNKTNTDYQQEQSQSYSNWHSIDKILLKFGMTDTLLATCFSELNIKGLGHSTLRSKAMLNGKSPVATYEKAIEGVKRIFPNYNFENQQVIDRKAHEADLQTALNGVPRCLENNHKQKSEDPTSKQLRTGDKQILDNLEGIYYGYFYDNEKYKHEVKNFIFLIKPSGSVELRAGETYYKFGEVIIDSLNVAFLLNNRNGNSPELYYTKLPKSFDGDDFEVVKMILTGVWSNIDSDPSFGSSVLFKHGGSKYNFESSSKILEEIKNGRGSIKGLDIGKLQIKKDTLNQQCLNELAIEVERGIIYKTISQDKPNKNDTALIRHKMKIEKVQK